MRALVCTLAGLGLLAPACSSRRGTPPPRTPDPYSFGNPSTIKVVHLDLDLTVDFAKRRLFGHALLQLEAEGSRAARELRLDTRDLLVRQVQVAAGGGPLRPARFQLKARDKLRGAALIIELPAGATRARIEYETRPRASALQWLTPAQTAGRKKPFLFSEGQSIHTRSWIPLQDSPANRLTYRATIRTPPGFTALMSATGNPRRPSPNGIHRFKMPYSIPPYLIALVVGDLQFQSLGARTGVYTEPPQLARAAQEFADTGAMLKVAERLCGPYRWGRFDVVVLPPSYSSGGMENPLLTFLNPTIIAGDKSLVATLAHEIAHSWAGNLVTNATWRDVWLNEGLTNYLEGRILEAVYGRRRAEMAFLLEHGRLKRALARLAPADQALHATLRGRDPDIFAFTTVAYTKGELFFRALEATVGRARLDPFLRSWFARHAFRSVTTRRFLDFAQRGLLDPAGPTGRRFPLRRWLFQAGLPAGAPRPDAKVFQHVEAQVDAWRAGRAPQPRGWTTQEWLYFLRRAEKHLDVARMTALDQRFRLTQTGNAVIASRWLALAVHLGYAAAWPRIERFLRTVGRTILIKPIYQALATTPRGRERGLALYRRAKPGYGAQTAAEIDRVFNKAARR